MVLGHMGIIEFSYSFNTIFDYSKKSINKKKK